MIFRKLLRQPGLDSNAMQKNKEKLLFEKYIYPDSNQFRDTPRIFVFDNAILWNTTANKTIA